MNKEISIFKNPALIGYLIKKMAEVYPEKQVGKTIVQKLIYILVKTGILFFRYSMFHYGPFSSEVAGELDYAENLDIVRIDWKYNEGYFISPSKNIDHFEHLLSYNEKKQMDQLVQYFGSLSAADISILATALFLQSHFNTPKVELSQVVRNLKPKYSIEHIEGIINNHTPQLSKLN